MTLWIKLLLWSISVLLVAAGDDFYQLLGLDRQATTREIRKAFKKLALEKHPDKNQDDPDAHDKFLRINRAYEVLKDEDLRKKYDMYGEDGLKEDGPSGRGFRSWNFYQHEFGIYDDDAEIITLSKSDFEQSVDNTDDIWFINFYSPHCGHCHDLAPTWREVARELEGVIRIGAVNCEDDWSLCRQQGIHSYPSLIMYPQREKYHGDRTTRALVKHSLRQVRAQVHELWAGNWNDEIEDDGREQPWLISFCGEGGDCLEDDTVTKLAAMLDELVNVGEITCASNEKICEKLGIEYGTYYFDAGDVRKGAGLEITTLDAKEIAFTCLRQLPEVLTLNEDGLKDALEGKNEVWVMHFVDDDTDDLELRKLPAMLYDYHVGRIDCRVMRTTCNDLHVHKFPAFMVMKPGRKFEMYHGRQTAHDIAAFARLSASARVETLGPDDFPHPVTGGEPWFVDFFAPWCPPCMRLLPEFRKASREMNNVKFGTVDCTIHQTLCQNYNIRSYPTTIFYNNTVPHQFRGHHNVHSIVEFLHDTLNPPVISLTPDTFDQLVAQKSMDEIWLVDFFSPHCGPCQQLAPEWRRLAKALKNMKTLNVAQVDCVQNRDLCQQHNVRSYPSIRLYPTGQNHARHFHSYNGWFRDAQSIRAWAFEYMPSKVESLNFQKFHQALASETPWIIDFFAPWCGHCQVFAPEFERIAGEMEGKVKAGKVDCDSHQYLCQQAGIQAYPTIRFFKGAKGGVKQSVYGEEIDSQDGNYIMDLLNRKVPKAKNLKHNKDEL